MIPLRLSVSGFLSYRDPVEIDFSPLHVAVILGSNGAGKSSLLDAMTWALFGKARAKNGDDIINTACAGKTAYVTFDFLFEDRVYRVQREKALGKAMKVDLLARGTDESEWRALSGKKGLETTGQIAKILGMEYETFVNASFFLQGHADQFTSAKPAERKKILNNILNLDIWEDYRKSAQKKQSDAETKLSIIQNEITREQAELDEEPLHRARLAEVEAALKSAEGEQKVAQANFEAAKSAGETLRVKQQTLDGLRSDEKRKNEAVQSLEKQLFENQEKLRQIEKQLETKDAVTRDYQQLRETKSQLEALANTAVTYQTLTGEKNRLKDAIDGEHLRLSGILESLERREPDYRKAVEDRTSLGEQLAKYNPEAEALRAECAELSALNDRLNTLAKELADADSRKERACNTAVEKKKKRNKYNELAKARSELQAKLDELNPQAGTLRTECAQLPALIDRLTAIAGEIGEGNTRLKQLEKDADQYKEKRENYRNGLGAPCPVCGRGLDEAHFEVYSKEIEAEIQKLRDEYGNKRQELKALDTEQKEKSQKKQELEKKQENLNDLDKQISGLTGQLDSAAKSITELDREEREAFAFLAPDAEPPADCGALIDREVEILLDKHLKEIEYIETLETERGEKTEKQRSLQKKQNNLNEIEKNISQWTARLESAEQTIAAWEKNDKAELEKLRREVPAGEFALEEREKLASVEAQIGALNYDQAAHEELKQRQQSLDDAEARYQALQLAVGAEGPAREMVSSSDNQLKTARGELQVLTEKRTAAEEDLETYRQTVPDLDEARLALENASEKVRKSNQDKGSVLQQLTSLDGVRASLEKAKLKEKETNELINDYKELVRAFSGKGIPALLMEQALPELEEKANDILQQLSDGEMSLQFLMETDYASKSAEGKKQTLDILISDAYGTRDYDMFSGGEAFRINFSVRLALSKLLSRRAGSRLQTLVIDEGFGSQDEEGRQRLIDAINTVSNEFEKILIISHLPELKEAFPSSIEVTKDASGSHAEVRP